MLKALLLAAWATLSYSGYIVTTPSSLVVGSDTQVCVYLESPATDSDSLTLSVTNRDDVVLPPQSVNIKKGETAFCNLLSLPEKAKSNYGNQISLSGHLGGVEVNHTKDVNVVNDVLKTFIQTDKYLYKPGQKVQFRILTLQLPFLKVSTMQYSEITVETPSGSRIQQWNDVDNTDGLIQMSFQLAEEPEEGVYKIRSFLSNGYKAETNFKIEEYVLPRYEVVVTPPSVVLGNDKEIPVEVCARYTFGQPVNGILAVSMDNNAYGSYKKIINREANITGCETVTFTMEDLRKSYRYIYSVTVTATVTEDGTGEKMSGKAVINLHFRVINFELISAEDWSKAELPYLAKIKATYQDQKPAANEPMSLCIRGDGKEQCKDYTTDGEGILSIVIPPHIKDELVVRASNYNYDEDGISMHGSRMTTPSYTFRWSTIFSPTNSSLAIYLPDNKLECIKGTNTLKVPIMFATSNEEMVELHVQVTSRGQIQAIKTVMADFSVPGKLPFEERAFFEPLREPETPSTIRGLVNVDLTLPSTISPVAKVLAWFTRKDSEVVADVREMNIEKCLMNDVQLSWASKKVEPGAKNTLRLNATPNSICSLGIVDKSVELLNRNKEQLTIDSAFALIERIPDSSRRFSPWQSNYEYCKKQLESTTTTTTTPAPEEDETTQGGRTELDEPFGRWRPHHFYYDYISPYSDAQKMFDRSGVIVFSDLRIETRPCEKIMSAITTSTAASFTSTTTSQGHPQTFVALDMWPAQSGFSTASNVEAAVRTYFPHTWLWSLLETEESGTISQELKVPDTITEWIGKAVCVHPKVGLGLTQEVSLITFTPFFVDLTLPAVVKRGEVFPVKISVFNYLESDLPVKVVLEESPEFDILEGEEVSPGPGIRSSCIPAKDKRVQSIRIRPKALGDVNITVGAFVDEAFPEVCGPEVVISKRDLLVKPIKVEAEGFPREKTWTKYLCSKDLEENTDFFEEWKVETPPNIVQDSERGWITVVGDLLGPTLDNLGSLIRQPYGCGEQNMLNFAPNIFILQYLEASNQKTPEVVQQLKQYMSSGYQRELRYRHRLGSYSAFGESDESGSTWLSAFVLKSFAQAKPYILIDPKDINITRDWLINLRMENGCFESVGKVLHKGMKGGLADSDSPVPLSAFVIIALMEAGESPESLKESWLCLGADKSKGPYTLALKSYALAIGKQSEAASTIADLLSAGIEDSTSLYWNVEGGAAVQVETAGYAILAMITQDAVGYIDQARKVIKWMSAMRNGQGGFVSTQDTVVALQAMALYESMQDSGPTDLVITAEGKNLAHSFRVNEKNKLLQQMVTLPTIPTDVILDMVGEGCALAQAVVRYNVHEGTAAEVFSLNVTATTVADKGCKTKKIQSCVSYHHPDGQSNMAVIEVKLVSGYIPQKDDLKRLVGYGTGILKRYEVDGNIVYFYADQITAQPVCVKFNILREVEVENPKAGSVKVYDYYEPEFVVSESYTLPPKDECLEIVDLIPIPLEDIVDPNFGIDVYDADY